MGLSKEEQKMRRIWNNQKMKNSKVWYVLNNKEESTEIYFSSYDLMLEYYKSLPLSVALHMSWTVHAE